MFSTDGNWSEVSLPPLPVGRDELLAQTEQLLFRAVNGMSEPEAARSLLDCGLLGYVVMAGDSSGERHLPDWLTDIDSPVDVLDVIFLGASFPGSFRSPVEFGHARDAWLEVLSAGPNRREVAQTVSAAVEVCEDMDTTVDDPLSWLAVLLRMSQAKVGVRPLSANAMPRRALEGHRAIYGPAVAPVGTEPPLDAADAMLAFIATPVGSVGTAQDAIRSGLCVLAAATLDEVATVGDLAAAAGPMYVGSNTPGHGTAEEVAEADSFEDWLNERLGGIDHPAEILNRHSTDSIRSAVEELGAPGILAALRLGLSPTEPRGTAVRESGPWAFGLLLSSALCAVTDTLLASSITGESGMVALARISALPELTAPLQRSDFPFRGSTGNALTRLAMAAGVTRVSTRTGSTRALTDLGSARMEAQLRAFERRFGRPPRPHEPVFFDPDQDEPTPLSTDTMAASVEHMLVRLGLSELTVKASELAHSEPPVSRFFEADRQAEWDAAVAEAAVELGLDAEEVADQRFADDTRWRLMLSMSTLRQMSSDQQFAQQTVAALRALVADLPDDEELDVATGAGAASLAHDLRWSPDLRAYAAGHPGWDVPSAAVAARRWGDAPLAADVTRFGPLLGVHEQGERGDHDQTQGEDEEAPVTDLGWAAVPAVAVLLAATLSATP